MSQEIARLDAIQREIASVQTPAQAKQLYDQLETLSQYAKRYGLEHEQQNEIADAKLQTARMGGLLLASMPMFGRKDVSRDGTRLPEGMSRNQSSRWQRLAEIPDDVWDAERAKLREQGQDGKTELTLAALLRIASELQRAMRLCCGIFTPRSHQKRWQREI